MTPKFASVVGRERRIPVEGEIRMSFGLKCFDRDFALAPAGDQVTPLAGSVAMKLLPDRMDLGEMLDPGTCVTLTTPRPSSYKSPSQPSANSKPASVIRRP
jgi:hypothetical protein